MDERETGSGHMACTVLLAVLVFGAIPVGGATRGPQARGRCAAEQDLKEGRFVRRSYGDTTAPEHRLASLLLRKRYGVESWNGSCGSTEGGQRYNEGYNATVSAALEAKFGRRLDDLQAECSLAIQDPAARKEAEEAGKAGVGEVLDRFDPMNPGAGS